MLSYTLMKGVRAVEIKVVGEGQDARSRELRRKPALMARNVALRLHAVDMLTVYDGIKAAMKKSHARAYDRLQSASRHSPRPKA
jgi:hypothetical protein